MLLYESCHVKMNEHKGCITIVEKYVLLEIKVQVGAESPIASKHGTVACLRDKYHGYFI